jgi:hypothetical protein
MAGVATSNTGDLDSPVVFGGRAVRERTTRGFNAVRNARRT